MQRRLIKAVKNGECPNCVSPADLYLKRVKIKGRIEVVYRCLKCARQKETFPY